ncbi:MAG: ribosome biogenesis GTPase Der [Deltaproteobacteria bacterium]|nr:ribosome biogenesis GTPase Der [Deltaproteobacteria bacterium]
MAAPRPRPRRRPARPASPRPAGGALPESLIDPPLPRAEVLAALPVVALVGRPNTGKSTLFNRLTRSRRALVGPTPGVTRDRNVGIATLGDRRVLVVDTGGFEADEQEALGQAVRAQALVAAESADVIVAVLDARAGLNPLDRQLIERLRPLRQPVLIAVNKVDTGKQDDLVGEFFALGLPALFAISAEHGLGVGELVDAIVERLPAPPVATEGGEASTAEAPTAVAIIGRPNVGKSSLLNRLVGYERAIVSAIPGTTRDALDTPITRAGRAYVLVDTAGVRRRGRVQAHLERASVVRALRALERAEVGVLVVDAVEGMTEQDARVAGYAWERGRALLVLVNKWDAVPEERRDAARFAAEIDRRYPSLAVVPKRIISALTGRGVERIWGAIDAVAAAHRARLPTAKVNGVIEAAVRAQEPPMVQGVRPRLFYATQTATAPPTITVFCRAPEKVTAHYERFLLNQLRAAFDLDGTPIRLRFKPRPRDESRQAPPKPGGKTHKPRKWKRY